MAVLAIVALALPGRHEPAPSADRETVAADFARLVSALDAHVVDTGRWPFDVSLAQGVDPASLLGLLRDEAGLRGWAGPYLVPVKGAGEAHPAGLGWNDPWGRPYHLHALAGGEDGISLVLWSGGPNGASETGARALRSGRARGDDIVLAVNRSR